MRMARDRYDIYRIPRLKNSSLIVSWKTQDIGKVGEGVLDFLIERLGGDETAEIRPLPFFSFEGAVFKDSLVQVPESKFLACEDYNLLLFKSDEPSFEYYKFLNNLLDFAQHHCGVRELYTVSGAPTFTAHTRPRRILAVYNQKEFQKELRRYDALVDMTWEGPPAINSYLLWVAGRRGLRGVSLWPEVPFYLVASEDPEAIKATLSFLGIRLGLDLDLEELEEKIALQKEKITRIRKDSPEIDEVIEKLEKNIYPTEKEQVELTKKMHQLLKE